MYRATGDTAHEWIGVFVCAVCIAHNTLNWKWYRNILKGTYNIRRTVLTAVNLLLVLAMVTLITTGLLHSRTLLAFLHLPGDRVIRQMHTTAAYWCLSLVCAHLGLNWGVILTVFRKTIKTNGENNTRKIVLRIITLTLVAFGVWSSFDRGIASKLFLGFSFDYWPEERLAILFFAVNLSIMGLYASATYYALKAFDWLHLWLDLACMDFTFDFDKAADTELNKPISENLPIETEHIPKSADSKMPVSLYKEPQ